MINKDIYEGVDLIQTENNKKYLGDIVTNDGENNKDIEARENRGRGITKDLLANVKRHIESNLKHSCT